MFLNKSVCNLVQLSLALEGKRCLRSKNYLSGFEMDFITYRKRSFWCPTGKEEQSRFYPLKIFRELHI